MSLLDNKKGLTILSALFLLIACEEPSELPLGISPKQGIISSHYIEIPIETTQIRVDDNVRSTISLINTANSVFNTSTYIGKMDHPIFGQVKATAYTNIALPVVDSIPSLTEEVTATSASLHLKLTGRYIGNNISASQTLKVYHVNDTIKGTSTTESSIEYLEYHQNTSHKLELEEVGFIGKVDFDTASIENNIIKIDLDPNSEVISNILNQIKSNRSVLTEQEAFNDTIGALAFVAGDGNTFIADYNFQGSESKLNITVNNASTSTISFSFAPLKKENIIYRQLPTYFSLETDYSGTAFEGIESIAPNTPFQTSDNQLYFRAGVGLLPKISFPELEDFVTSETEINGNKVVINSAVLEIDSIQRSYGDNIFAPPQLSFYFVKGQNNNKFKGVNDEPNAGAQLIAQQYKSSQGDTLLRYKADIAEEIDWYINNKNVENSNSSNYLQGMLFQAINSSPSSFAGLVVDPQRIVLKIYYTTLSTNQD